MGRSNRRVIPLGPITVRPMHQLASVVANTLCCKLSLNALVDEGDIESVPLICRVFRL